MTVSKIQLQPGDILVASVPGRLGDNLCPRVKEALKKEFPGHHVILLEEGMTLSAITPVKPRAAHMEMFPFPPYMTDEQLQDAVILSDGWLYPPPVTEPPPAPPAPPPPPDISDWERRGGP